MKLGSLFDGSGGFPLAGALCGVVPVWASEVEPYPIAVTTSRFPDMKHLGDISKVNGADIEPVDIITFGSPCQDMSVAGKRAGLKHEDNGDDETTRSGLFMEAVRIIKEMREKTNGEYPRYAIWENVPGAFSSNGGEDFRLVIEELIKVVEPTAVMPAVPQKGWAYADSYCGDGWSLAYRVLDAQYWGVPQRRRRIYLVADFGGQCAREILFEREGLRGYFAESGTPWKAIAPHVEGGIGADDREGAVPYTLKIRSGVSVDSLGKAAGKGALIQKNLSATLGVSQDQYLFQPVTLEPGIAAREGGHIYKDVSGTLRAKAGDNQMAVAYGISSYESNAMKSDNPHSGVYEADTSRTLDANGGNPACNQGGIAIVEPSYGVTTKGNGDAFISKERHTALSVGGGQAGQGYPCTMQPVAGFCTEHSAKSRTIGYEEEVSPTLRAGVTPAVVYGLDGDKIGKAERAGGSGMGVRDDNKMYTLTAKDAGSHGVAYGVDAYNQALTGDKAKTLNSAASDADHVPCAVYSVENHPADSRVNLDESGKVQTLTSRMGTGGGNVPMVMEPFCKEHRAKDKDDATTWKHADVANTLNTFDQGEARANELVVESAPVLTASKASFFMRAEEELASTLVATDYKDPQLVAYSFDPGASRDVGVLFIEECGKTLTNGTCPGHHDGVVIARPIHSMTTGDYMQVNEEKTATLLARDYKDPTCVETYDAATQRYIVRRLTPTECARLQGFADRWGDIDPKSDLTDEEYRFWHEVRKTHDAINGKPAKEYTDKQILTWYNKLHTDSSEYKLWGNGIALPNALYVLQGIAEVTKGEKND